MLLKITAINNHTHQICTFDTYQMCIFDVYDYYKTGLLLCFNNICVSSLKMTITPKHVGAN